MRLPNRSKAAVVITSIPLVLLAVVAVLLLADDVRRDRTHTVTVGEGTPVFAGGEHNCDTRQRTAIVQRSFVLPVRRIRYWKDCATVDMNLPDHGLAHFVVGVG